MSSVTIKIDATKYKQFLTEAPLKILKAVSTTIQKGALVIEGKGKKLSPVDTGRMRSSISSEVRQLEATIKPNVDYAIFVHEGTRFIRGRPFMTQSAQDSEGQIQDILDIEIKRALN